MKYQVTTEQIIGGLKEAETGEKISNFYSLLKYSEMKTNSVSLGGRYQ